MNWLTTFLRGDPDPGLAGLQRCPVELAGSWALLWLWNSSISILNLPGTNFLFLCCQIIRSLEGLLTPSLLPHLCPQPFHHGVATGLNILRTISAEHCLSVSWPVWYHCHCPRDMPAVVCALLWAPSLLSVLGGTAGASCFGVLTRFGVRCLISSLPHGWWLYWWLSPGPAWPCWSGSCVAPSRCGDRAPRGHSTHKADLSSLRPALWLCWIPNDSNLLLYYLRRTRWSCLLTAAPSPSLTFSLAPLGTRGIRDSRVGSPGDFGGHNWGEEQWRKPSSGNCGDFRKQVRAVILYQAGFSQSSGTAGPPHPRKYSRICSQLNPQMQNPGIGRTS